MDFSSMAKYAGASSLIDFGKDIFDKAVSYYQNKNTARQAQANTRKNMQEQADLELAAQFKSVANSTAALRAAGINPAVAATGAFSAAPTVSATPAPMANPGQYHGSHDFANNLMAMAQADLTKSQIELNEAATDKTNAEADSIRSKQPHEINLLGAQKHNIDQLTEKYGVEQLLLGKEFEHKLSEDDYITKRLNNYIRFRVNQAESKGDELERDLWLSLQEQSASGLSLGTLAGMQRFSEYVNALDEYDKEAVLRQVVRSISRLQLRDDGLLNTIAHMPEKDASLKLAQIAEALANRDFRKAYKEELIPAQKASLNQEVEASRHKDFVGLAKDGDIGGAAAYLVPDLLHIGEEYLLLRYLGKGPSGVSKMPAPKDFVPSIEHSETWTDKRGHEHHKYSKTKPK